MRDYQNLPPLGNLDTMPRMDVTGRPIEQHPCPHPVARIIRDWYGIEFMGRDESSAFLCAECGRRLTIDKHLTELVAA